MKNKSTRLFGNYFIAAFFLLFSVCAVGQNNSHPSELYSDAAQKVLPGAYMVKLNPQSPIPSWVVFNEGSQMQSAAFLSWFISTYKIPSNYEFVLHNESTDDVNNTHLKYDLLYNGIPIDMNWLTVHTKNNLVYQFNGNVQIIGQINTSPKMQEEQALAQALRIVGEAKYMWENPREQELLKARTKNPNATYFPEGELILVQEKSSAFTLAWKFDINTENLEQAQQIFINAATGEKIKSYPLFFKCNTGTVASTWYGTQNISTDKNGDDNFILLDDCGGPEIHTTQTDGSDFVAADNNWTAAGETGPGTTHLHGRITMDYFSVVHTRDSYDGMGGDFEMRYIDESNAYSGGNGLIRIGNSNSADDDEHYNTLDVVAHEFTHSVTNNTSQLVYQDESGALNESFSDIFGETCEMWYEGLAPNQWDWLHREDYYTGENRSFINPNDKNDPDTYFGTNWAPLGGSDNGGVHSNSGVQNYWFYLLTVGGSGTNDNGDAFNVSGIGLTKARTISWDNLTAQLGENSQFADARAGAIAAAISRYSACSNEVKQVTNAWYAVGVGNPYVEVSLWYKQHVSCAGAADGKIGLNVDGTGPFTYVWSDGPANTKDRTGLSGGVYTVTVTDATNCTATIDVTIDEPAVLTISIINESDYNGFNVTCHGAADGIAISQAVGGTPPYAYVWDDPNNHMSASADDLPAGDYTVTVTDANGCMASTMVNISEPPVLTALITSVSDYNGFNISCNGGSDGWAEVTAGGGVPPYTYSWNDGANQATAKAENLMAGNYSVTVTDANGCTAMDNVMLTEPTPLTIDAGPNQTVYFGYPPAECADIAWSGAGGGVPPYTISWDDGGAQAHQVCPGNMTTVYTVTIEDANGCIETDEVTICVIDVRCGKKLDKVEMCHVPNGNPGNEHTICVAIPAVAQHLAHGDMLAACGTDHSCDDNAKTSPPKTIYHNTMALDAYPNPFKESTTVEFTSGIEGHVSVELYDNIGRLLKVIYNGDVELGLEYRFTINASEVASGLNLIILRHADGTTIIKKMIAEK